jgi:hypothetical protein
MQTTTTTTTTYRNIGEYVWAKYRDGSLDVEWANDGEYAAATYGRFVIDPTIRTVSRYENADEAALAALAAGGPGSEDYWLVYEVIDRDTGETGYAAYRNDRKGTRVGTPDVRDWRTLAQAVNDDMDEQGVYGSVFLFRPEFGFLESRYCPELLEFVGLPDGPLTFKYATVPVLVDEWTV